ncbi:unnamed protein product [Prunus armeniaca]
MNSCGNATQNFFNDDSDDDDLHQQRVAMTVQHHMFLLEQYVQQSKHGGSVADCEYKNRKREKHHKSLIEDYFCERPLYLPVDFRRRIRMRRELFYRILNDVVAHKPYFTQKIYAYGQQSLSPKQKLIVVFRMLAYGCSADSTNEYCRLGESTALECLRKFCSVIEAVYGQWYLRSLNSANLYRLLHKASSRGFPGMLGNLDCMHWEWKNCPTAWVDQFTGCKHKPTIVL